jgi:hypothetical protein
MARVVPSYDEGQLILAGIRVQAHKEGRPPLLEDVAVLLGLPAELLRVLTVELEERGIVRQLTNAFETRLDILDHRKSEDLPREGSGVRMNSEVAEFRKAFREKQEEIKKTFGSGAFTKQSDDKMNRLQEELKKFKDRGGLGRPTSSLGDPPPDDD